MESVRRKRENRIIGLIGVKGAGKTVRAKQLFRASQRAFVIDPLAEYEQGYIVSAHGDTLDYLCETEKFRVIYRPLEPGDFVFACETVRRAKDCTFIVEELGRYCDNNSIPDEFDDIVARGRHYGVNLVYTVQRFQMIHKNVTSLTDEYYVFRQCEPVDLEQVEKRFGDAVARIVRDLDDLEAVHIRVKEFRAHVPKSYRVVSIIPGSGVFHHQLPAGRDDYNNGSGSRRLSC